MKRLLFLIALLSVPACAQTKKRATDLPAITGAEVDLAADRVPLTDASAGTTKGLSLVEMWNAFGGSSVSAAEFAALDGVSLPIQQQINARLPVIEGVVNVNSDITLGAAHYGKLLVVTGSRVIEFGSSPPQGARCVIYCNPSSSVTRSGVVLDEKGSPVVGVFGPSDGYVHLEKIGSYWVVISRAGAGNFLRNDPTVTGLTGGHAAALDGIPTYGVAPGVVQMVHTAGAMYFYRLLSGAVYADNVPKVIMPDDYYPLSNQKYWSLLSMRVNTLVVEGAATFASNLGVIGNATVHGGTSLQGGLTLGAAAKSALQTEMSSGYDKAVTGLTGGGASNLDGLAVTAADVGRVQRVAAAGGYLYDYVLESSTDAESVPSVIAPDAGGDLRWKLRVCMAAAFRAPSIRVSNGNDSADLSYTGSLGVGLAICDHPGTISVVVEGSAGPSEVPAASGMFYFDPAGVIYVSVGTSSVSDWVPFATTQGHPIGWNATQSKFQKLTITGAAGAETITVSDL